MNNEMSVTVRRNELMRSGYDIFNRSAETTRYTEMCKKKVKELVEYIEKDMANSNMERVGNANVDVDANVDSDGLMKCSHNDLPILDPPCVREKGVTNARIRSHLEKRKRRVPKDVTKSKKITNGKPSKTLHQAPQGAGSCQHISTPVDDTNYCDGILPEGVNISNQNPFFTWNGGSSNVRFTIMLQNNEQVHHLTQVIFVS
ncbi:protein FAR1-RELATED SEQUENCE 5-like [Fagus crenata]